MKLTKQSNRIKSRIVSFVAAIALILCAVLSLGYILPDRIARAEDEPSAPAAKVADGIRFVQVAAGYDFAIGLTYDRKLYGWSTKASRDTSNMQSLGDYYTENPTEIKVTFRKGPSVSTYRFSDNAGSENYHTPRTDDKIKSIAATGTTAAFVTDKGYLYTWGVDTNAKHDVAHNDGSKTNYLLLRATDENNYSWKVPYIIDYHYYGEAASTAGFTSKYSTEQLIPTNDAATFTSLAAGEYNYIFGFIRNYPPNGTLEHSASGNMYHTYVWGSALYNAVNTLPSSSFSYATNSISVEANGRKIFNTFVEVTDYSGTMSVVAGGYTVGINNTAANVAGGTSLQLRGRNFITTANVSATGDEYTVANTSQLVTPASGSAAADITFTGGTAKNAIAGGNGDSGISDGSLYGHDTERYYARQAGSLTYGTTEAGFLINSKAAGTGDDNRIATYQAAAGVNAQGQPVTTSEAALKPVRYAVALGNDIGYGITEAGKLYGWGDNAHGQLTGVTGSKDTPTPLLSSENFISVAAGKQKSPESIGVRAFFNNTETISGNAFTDAVKNDDKYITGALTDDGNIYAWSKGIAAKPLSYMNTSGDKRERFAAVYSGYGEILYAVTESGKLVRITKNGNDFEQYVYDEFYTLNSQGTAVKVENWNVDKTNKVVFTPSAAATVANPAPEFDTAVFYVWSNSITAAAPAPEEGEQAPLSTYINYTGAGTTQSPYVSSAYKLLVSENKVGDAYRIIGLTAGDAEINYLKADDLNPTNYAPKFYFDSNENGTGGSLMSPKQQQNMFTFSEVYGPNGEGVGISIKPLQSSKGKNIRVDFYIARYNRYDRYNNTANGDNAIYYDYKQCSIIFSIADTPSVITYSAYNAQNGNKCNIPLLDPNNPYNSVYSIAVQNVSTGVDELIKFLTGNNTTVNPNFKTAVMTEMKKDIGFPNSENVTKGDLTYYLNTEDLRKYNYVKGADGNNTIAANDSVYQFIFTDRDSERIRITTREGETTIMDSEVAGAVEGEIKTITVKVEYLPSNFGIAGANANVTADGFGSSLLKLISTEFNNKYGLYGFTYTTENEKNYLSFKYDVITFTAKKATGIIGYSGDSTEAASVTNYNTMQGQPHATASFMSYTLNKYTYTDAAGYVESEQDRTTPYGNNSNVVRVFSQASLRLKSSVAADTNGQANGTKNTYTETHRDITTDPLYVGDTKTIRLTDYVNNIGDLISFSFSKSTVATKRDDPASPASSASLAEFGNQFKDFSGHNMRVVTLTGNTITVHPTTAAPINFTVEIQRFVDTEKNRFFKNGNDVDEKIYLTFNFNNIVGFNMTARAQAKTEYTITKSTTIDLFGEGSGVVNAGDPFIDLVSVNGGSLSNASAVAYAELKSSVQIDGLESSEKGKYDNEKLFSVTDPQKTKFTITPRRSGTGTIVFSANVYDKSLTFKLTIHVSALTELGESKKISLIDYEYIPVSELDEVLRSANSFNAEVTSGVYRILHKDPAGAVYFEDEDGNTGYPPFVDSVVFERGGTSNATIRIKANNSSTSHSKTYKMYVRYTNAPEGVEKYEDVPADKSIIQIVIPISSGKVKLQAAEGGDLVASIDCRETKKGSSAWLNTEKSHIEGKHLNTKVTIDLLELLEYDKSTVGADKCTIFLLSADSAAAKYFQYDKSSDDKSIEITPKLNTNKNYELSVSVYNDSDKTTKVLTFEISIKGILTTLPVMTNDDGIIGYGNIWLYSFAIVFGVLFIIFMIRFIVYIRRRAKQRAIIKRNQDLIRLRDRMHGKANAASREQLVKSKLKMEDPKYAKMFNDMRRDKEEESGVALVNSDLAATADKKTKKKKKKGGKKSVAELKAELEAKKAAFAAAQAGNAQPVNPFATEVPLDGGFAAPDGGFADGGFVSPDGGFADGGGYAAPDVGFGDGGDFGAAQSIDGSDIIFDASDLGDGNM